MKIVSYAHGQEAGLGVLDSDTQRITPITTTDGSPWQAEDIATLLRATMPPGGDTHVSTDGRRLDLADVALHAPMAYPPRNVFCVGKNYSEHAEEFGKSGYDTSSAPGGDNSPESPIVFTKPRTCIIGPGVDIDPHADLTENLDYEAEIAIVIGRPGVGISRADAWDHVWGMTLVNDITARDLQQRHKQWFLGKCLDTFLPMGPWLVSMDELHGADIVLEGWVNGELRQKASLKDMIFDIPSIISTLSAGMALKVGDVIATGTPSGVGIGSDPPRFLKPGDEMVVSATGLGSLHNKVAVQ